MHFNPIGRRYFLRGLGAGLLLPYLPSVMPRAYAAGPAKRYVQVLTSMGVFGPKFYPSNEGMSPQGNTGISAKLLSSISGDISTIIGPAFNGLKSKISLVRGLNVLAASSLHNGSLPTCASGATQDNNGNGPPAFPWSIDAVMAESSAVYPDPTGKQRHVTFSPQAGPYENYSWRRANGRTEHLPTTHDTAALLAKFSNGFSSGGAAVPNDPKRLRQADVVQNVFDDYKALRDGGKISGDDKNRLEAYMTLINEVQGSLKSTGGASCTKPGQESESNMDLRHRNQIKVMVAALACDLTRVVSYVMDVGYDPMHAWAHNNGVDSHANVQRQVAEKWAFMLSEMDKVQEAGGTLLDNSVVYFGNEFGEIVNIDPHQRNNMPVIVAGGGGAFQLGYYIDYRATGSRPLNNLLVSFFNAMGVGSSGYQREGVVGFGEYARPGNLGQYVTNAERVKPLPFLYKGPSLG